MASLLSSLTVLSLEQATTLPFLTQRLAREGVRVIRVEPPGRGDPNRFVGADVLGEPDMRSYFLTNNCGKQAITLNLRDPEGRAILHELISNLPVDIFCTNNRPSSYVKLGIDYETIQTIRPNIIWLGTTGFGPDSDEAAYDPVIQARVGWMEITGEPDGSPVIFGLPMVDRGAAEHAYGAVMKALYRRAITGAGSRVDISMFHSALAWMANPLMLTALGDHVTRRGNTHQFFAPASVFPTADGYVYIAVGNDRQWEALVALDGFEALATPNYAHNAGRIADVQNLNARLSDCTRNWTTANLIAKPNPLALPLPKANPMAEALQAPPARPALRHVRDEQSGLEVPLPPLDEVGVEQVATLAFPPSLGEHNASIFGAELGFDSDRLADLEERGVI